MWSGSETQSAHRIPDLSGGSVTYPAKEAQPEIVSAAVDFNAAERELHHLYAERGKVDEGIRQATQRMEEAAAHMRAILDRPSVAQSNETPYRR